MAKYVMIQNVRHGEGEKIYDLPIGAECPSELINRMVELGYAEQHVDAPIPKAPKPVEKPKKKAADFPEEKDGLLE